MLANLEIENFKCLAKFDQQLGALTLLTGLNAAGKSSVIQALALLRQTAVENEWGEALQLNGSSVELGSMFDVIDRNFGGSGFSISLGSESWSCRWDTTSQERKRDLVARISAITLKTGNGSTTWEAPQFSDGGIRRLLPQRASEEYQAIFNELGLKLTSMCHLGAERIGPREVYVAQTPLAYPDVGSRGEKTPWCLEQFGDEKTNPGTGLPGIHDNVRLLVEAWMAQLFPGFRLEIKRVDATNLVTMGIRTSPRGDFFRPTNVGFGLSHVLPIVTACVAARPGQILLIENPETHLHPAGQSMIGSFVARAASAGVQVILETHSDHVLNGIRRVIRDGKLAANKTKIYFFRNDTGDKGDVKSVVEPVHIDERGQVSGWPRGFFDQLESDVDYIFRE